MPDQNIDQTPENGSVEPEDERTDTPEGDGDRGEQRQP